MHDYDAALSFEHNLAKSIFIERREPAQIEYAYIADRISGFECWAKRGSPGDNGGAGSGLSHSRFSDRLNRTRGADGAGRLIEPARFKQNARIGRGHGRPQKIVSVLGSGGQSDSQARNMREQRFQTL